MADAAALYTEAEKLKDSGQLEPAIEKLKEALEADPNYTLAHLALAVVYGKVNQHELAVQHAQRAVEIEPDEAFNFTALSVTYQRAFAGTQNHQYIQLAEDAMARAHMLQTRH